MSHRKILATACLLGLSLAAMGQGMPWQKNWTDALAAAKASGKPILVCVNMDKEKANDRIAAEHYQDAKIIKLADEFVCLVASKFHHTTDDSPCPRFGGLTCSEHVKVEQHMRDTYFPENEVNSPQHLALRSDGTLFKAKVFFVTKAELESFMLSVLQELRPERYAELTGQAKTPDPKEAEKPVESGGPEKPAPEGGAAPKPTKPRSPGELEPLIRAAASVDEIRKLGREMLASEDPEARPTFERIFADKTLDVVKRCGMLQAIGKKGDEKAADLVLPFLSHKDPEVRAHAAVAIEDCAVARTTAVIRKRLDAEKEEDVRKELVRALGAAGLGDKKVSAELVDYCRDRSTLVQRNAAIALGGFKEDKKAEKALLDLALNFGGGGRGAGAWRTRRQVSEAAAYGLVAMGSKEAKVEVQKRADAMKDPRMARAFDFFIEMLDRDFDPTAVETMRWRIRAGGDKIRRATDTDAAWAPGPGPGDGGDGGDGAPPPRR